MIPLNRVARALRVPVKWLKTEAENGRIPVVDAGGVFLAEISLVEETLAKRAKGGIALLQELTLEEVESRLDVLETEQGSLQVLRKVLRARDNVKKDPNYYRSKPVSPS